MIKIALPAGDLRMETAGLLSACRLNVEGYGEGSRSYRLSIAGRDDVSARVFREKDIPVQVALGNYDLGICSLAWVEEMQVRFPQQPLTPLLDLGIGPVSVYVASSPTAIRSLEDASRLPLVRLASDFPNICEAFAMSARFRRYRVQSVWGAAEAYPPEDADLVVIGARNEDGVRGFGLTPLWNLLDSSAWLIGNAQALRNKNLGAILEALVACGRPGVVPELRMPVPALSQRPPAGIAERVDNAGLRLAVPDGHQQRHVVAALAGAGLSLDGYDEAACVRRPSSAIEGLAVKVVRPHDMPQLVALRQFDLAVTGRDCLNEHFSCFPSSPVSELVDLRRGQYDLSAVISEDVPADDLPGAFRYWQGRGRQVIRIASEFMGTADEYARSRHIPRYQVIPIAGASEGFVPEDAELLIEGTETGRTLRENRLKPIDLLYRSTTCVIGHSSRPLNGPRRKLYDDLLSRFQTAAKTAQAV